MREVGAKSIRQIGILNAALMKKSGAGSAMGRARDFLSATYDVGPDRIREADFGYFRCRAVCDIAEFVTVIAVRVQAALCQPYLLQLPDAQRIVDASNSLLASPGGTITRDRKQIIGRPRVAAMRDRRGGRHADRGDRALRPIEPYR